MSETDTTQSVTMLRVLRLVLCLFVLTGWALSPMPLVHPLRLSARLVSRWAN